MDLNSLCKYTSDDDGILTMIDGATPSMPGIVSLCMQSQGDDDIEDKAETSPHNQRLFIKYVTGKTKKTYREFIGRTCIYIP